MQHPQAKLIEELKKQKDISSVKVDGDMVILECPWRNKYSTIFLAVGGFWMLFWLSIASPLSFYFLSPFLGFFLVILPITASLPGFWVFFIGLQSYFNKSRIEISPDFVSIETKPFGKSLTVLRKDIKQVFLRPVKKRTDKNLRVLHYIDGYDTQHLLSDRLFGNFSGKVEFKQRTAQLLERLIEEVMSIPNVPVYYWDKPEIGKLKKVMQNIENLTSTPFGLSVKRTAHSITITKEWDKIWTVFHTTAGTLAAFLVLGIAIDFLPVALTRSIIWMIGVALPITFISYVMVDQYQKALAYWRNRTEFIISYEVLEVMTVPFDLHDDHFDIRLANLQKIVPVKEKINTKKGRQTLYKLKLIRNDSKEPVLLDLRLTEMEAIFISYQLQSYFAHQVSAD